MARDDNQSTNTPAGSSENSGLPRTADQTSTFSASSAESNQRSSQFTQPQQFSEAGEPLRMGNEATDASEASQSRKAKEQVRKAGATIGEQASATAEELQQKMQQASQRAKQRGSELLDGQKHRAAEELSQVSSAIRRAADELHADHDDNLAEYVEMAAAKIDGMADYLRQRDLGRMYQDIESTARRRPELFFGGMFLVGLGLSRFLKASTRSHQGSREFEYPYS